MRLRDLKGLGPTSEKHLQAIGISSPEELKKIGAVQAFIKLKKLSTTKPSLLFLYALVGAIEDKHWVNIARNEKERLLTELEGYQELEGLLINEGIEFTF